MARSRGMQSADADDLAQQVLIAISGAIDRFEPDADRAKFRTWLATIVRRAIINVLPQQRADRAAGGSDVAALLSELPAETDETRTLSLDYRWQIFVVAAKQHSQRFLSGHMVRVLANRGRRNGGRRSRADVEPIKRQHLHGTQPCNGKTERSRSRT
ncbi:RNA polymerase sigma factor [Planctomycetes bacterium K23_9]|uniref:RNA polymerase sigma factor n=1 Tax=Stieleria marina TaxID=1930275 RepID=A0A517NND7_9BACT|nr:RNA polymerase sigma factor [Planctomycetes bacterium K23_9]